MATREQWAWWTAPGLAVTGLHALDGARYLRDIHQADAMLCQLVTRHSYAIAEAEECGLADVLAWGSSLHRSCFPVC